MTNLGLMSRLRGVELRLLAPSRSAAGTLPTVVDLASHRELVRGIRLLREQADGQFSISPSNFEDLRDMHSWHFVGVESVSGRVVGAIRVRVYDLAAGFPTVAELFAFSEVEIGDELVRMSIARTLTAYMADQAARCGRFYQIGGFAVAARRRGSALAPLLALAVYAWCENIGLIGGCTFATVENHVADFDMRLGAFLLTDGGSELPPFYCNRHQAVGRLLGTCSRRFEPRLSDTVAALADWLRRTTVVVPT
jgi:hypothetical protein